jgi:hypothetical protein
VIELCVAKCARTKSGIWRASYGKLSCPWAVLILMPFIVSEDKNTEKARYHNDIQRIHKAMGTLGLNVNEELLLQSLFLHCPSLMMLSRVL